MKCKYGIQQAWTYLDVTYSDLMVDLEKQPLHTTSICDIKHSIQSCIAHSEHDAHNISLIAIPGPLTHQ